MQKFLIELLAQFEEPNCRILIDSLAFGDFFLI